MVNALQAVLDRATVQLTAEKGVGGETPTPTRTSRAPAVPKTSMANATRRTQTSTEEPSKSSRPVRDGKRFVGAHFHPKVARQLKMLAAEDGTTIQELLEQAVDLLFVKNGKAKITELVRKG